MNLSKLFEELGKTIIGGLGDAAKLAWGFISEQTKNLFGKEGALSMDNIIQMGAMYGLAEALADDDGTKKNVRDLKKAYDKILPAFVEAKIKQGTLEQTALADLRNYLTYGVKTREYTEEDAAAGNIPADKKVGDRFAEKVAPGERDAGILAWTGQQPQYEVDEQGHLVMQINEAGQQVPKTVRTGFPGESERLRTEERLQSQKDREAYARGTSDIYDPAAGTVQNVGKGFREFEEASSPYLDASQAQQAASFQSLLASQDPSKLSGSEMANVERGLGRMGIGVGRTAEMDKYKAAMTFGDALAQKQQRLAQALGQTASVVPSLKGGYNPGILSGQAGVANLPTPAGQVTGFGTSAATGMGAATGMVDKSGGWGGEDYLRNTLFNVDERTGGGK